MDVVESTYKASLGLFIGVPVACIVFLCCCCFLCCKYCCCKEQAPVIVMQQNVNQPSRDIPAQHKQAANQTPMYGMHPVIPQSQCSPPTQQQLREAAIQQMRAAAELPEHPAAYDNPNIWKPSAPSSPYEQKY